MPRRGRKRETPADPPNPAVDAQLTELGMAPPEPDAAEPAPESAATVTVESYNEIPLTTAPSEAAFDPVPGQGDDIPSDADSALNPFRRMPLPAPIPTTKQQREARADARQATNQASPSAKRLGPSLATKVPGAEHIVIEKRVDTGTSAGKLAYIGEYYANDMAQSQSVKSFIARYISPKYGPGDYQITGVNAAGQTFDAGCITILQPIGESLDMPGVPSGNNNSVNPAFNFVQQIMDRADTRRDQELRALLGAQKDPVKMLREVHELQQTLAPTMPPLLPSDGRSSTTETMMAGMMQMMGTVLAVALKPKETDPLLLALINNLALPRRRWGRG